MNQSGGNAAKQVVMRYLTVIVLLAISTMAQKPVAELPRAHIDTTYDVPAGKKWAAHTSEDLRNALAKSVPGDVIVLDAGATYTGGFQLPAKENPQKKWIYVVSSQLANLPEGRRVTPTDATNMPKIVDPECCRRI